MRLLRKANWGDRRSKDAMIIIDFDSTCLHGRCRKWRGNERKRDSGFPFAALLFRVPDFAPTIVQSRTFFLYQKLSNNKN